MNGRAREWSWTGAAVAIAALYAFLVELRPARGLTFLWDDWHLLARIAQEPWPASWLEPRHEHWKPLFIALFHVERAAFGLDHTLFLAVTLAIHALNVGLLSRLLAKRTGDARAGALGALAFGLTTTCREVLWWAELGGLAACLTLMLAGFLALERALEGSRRATVASALCAFAAPLAFGSGLALGPALALEAWVLAPRERRVRLAASVLAGWGAYVLLYIVVAAPTTHAALAREAGTGPGAMLSFAVSSVGIGLVGRNLLLPIPETAARLWGTGLALGYAVCVAVLAWALEPRARTRLLLAQAWLALVIAPLALARAHTEPLAPGWSRYQYFPALTWTTAVALVLAPALRRSPRATFAATIVGLALLATTHARSAASDGRTFSPLARAHHLAFVKKLASAATSAHGPVYDAPLPVRLGLTLPPTSARTLVEVWAPGSSVAWTASATPASTAPFASDPALRLLVPAELR